MVFDTIPCAGTLQKVITCIGNDNIDDERIESENVKSIKIREVKNT